MSFRRARPVLNAAPGALPVTVAEVKRQAVVEVDIDDDAIARRLAAAIAWVERRTGRRLITQTWDLAFERFPPHGEALVLPYAPLQAVVHIKYTNPDGVLTTLDAGEYAVRTAVEPGEVVEAYTKSWPSARAVPDAVTVRFRCGYGDAAASVPAPIREAICVLAATRQAFREESVTGTIVSAAPFAAEELLRLWVCRRARPSGRAR